MEYAHGTEAKLNLNASRGQMRAEAPKYGIGSVALQPLLNDTGLRA